MKRKIIQIEEEKCNGCGLCVPNCHEGALQVIDGKVRLISDLFCDGLGACIGYCPEGAITIEEREAEPYDELKVIGMIAQKGKNTTIAHLKHLKEHQEWGFLKIATEYLEKRHPETDISAYQQPDHTMTMKNEFTQNEPVEPMIAAESCGCPGSAARDFNPDNKTAQSQEPVIENLHSHPAPSALMHWPVQLHLVNPRASYFQNADIVLTADCVAYAMGNFHEKYLKGKSIAIACPKLDTGLDVYEEKITAMIDQAAINTLTVIRMEVPCCGGLLQMAKNAQSGAERKVPLKEIVIGIRGNVLRESWI